MSKPIQAAWRRHPIDVLRQAGRPMNIREIVIGAYGTPLREHTISGWTSSVRKALTNADGTRCYRLGNDTMWELIK